MTYTEVGGLGGLDWRGRTVQYGTTVKRRARISAWQLHLTAYLVLQFSMTSRDYLFIILLYFIKFEWYEFNFV